MTGSNGGLNCVLQRQGGFQTRPYLVIFWLPFNIRVLVY